MADCASNRILIGWVRALILIVCMGGGAFTTQMYFDRKVYFNAACVLYLSILFLFTVAVGES